VRSILLGENQARHCLAVPALNRGRSWRGSAWRLGGFGPVCEAQTSTCCVRLAVGILVIHGREDVNTNVALLLDVGLLMMIGKGLLMAVRMDVTVVRGCWSGSMMWQGTARWVCCSPASTLTGSSHHVGAVHRPGDP